MSEQTHCGGCAKIINFVKLVLDLEEEIQIVIEDLLLELAKAENFICYRLPVQHHVILQTDFKVTLFTPNDLSLQGFVFHPYQETESCKPFYFDFTQPVEGKSNPKDDNINITYRLRQDSNYDSGIIFYQEQSFIDHVLQAKRAIASGQIQKIVLANPYFSVKERNLNELVRAFFTLTQKYPEAMVYMVYTKETGYWMGATPETLLRKHKNHLYTMALAGTQVQSTVHTSPVWTQKEIQEQAWVSRYIINVFKAIRLREFTESGPVNHITGNLVHLRTDYDIDLSEVHIPQVETKLLALLHPTSAVCGMPLESAKSLIAYLEPFQRQYYTGYLGPTSPEGFDLFVNLRCAQWYNNGVVYWAGAGVTIDSNPEAELEETRQKQAILSQYID